MNLYRSLLDRNDYKLLRRIFSNGVNFAINILIDNGIAIDDETLVNLFSLLKRLRVADMYIPREYLRSRIFSLTTGVYSEWSILLRFYSAVLSGVIKVEDKWKTVSERITGKRSEYISVIDFLEYTTRDLKENPNSIYYTNYLYPVFLMEVSAEVLKIAEVRENRLIRDRIRNIFYELKNENMSFIRDREYQLDNINIDYLMDYSLFFNMLFFMAKIIADAFSGGIIDRRETIDDLKIILNKLLGAGDSSAYLKIILKIVDKFYKMGNNLSYPALWIYDILTVIESIRNLQSEDLERYFDLLSNLVTSLMKIIIEYFRVNIEENRNRNEVDFVLQDSIFYFKNRTGLPRYAETVRFLAGISHLTDTDIHNSVAEKLEKEGMFVVLRRIYAIVREYGNDTVVERVAREIGRAAGIFTDSGRRNRIDASRLSCEIYRYFRRHIEERGGGINILFDEVRTPDKVDRLGGNCASYTAYILSVFVPLGVYSSFDVYLVIIYTEGTFDHIFPVIVSGVNRNESVRLMEIIEEYPENVFILDPFAPNFNNHAEIRRRLLGNTAFPINFGIYINDPFGEGAEGPVNELRSLL